MRLPRIGIAAEGDTKRRGGDRVGQREFSQPARNSHLGGRKESSEAVKEPEVCDCVRDPFSVLPPELQPRRKEKGSLRKLNCPVCGKEYWTNRETDLCVDCESNPADDHPPQELR